MKPLKETKIGQWLKEKAPNVLNVIGDVLPDKGILGIVKNLIDNDPTISPEDKIEYAKLEKELFELELKDKDSARNREIEITKTLGHSDYMTWFLSIALMACFFFIVWHLVRDNVPAENRELVTNIIGIIEGLLISIYSYYFGSSMGSRIKDMTKK